MTKMEQQAVVVAISEATEHHIFCYVICICTIIMLVIHCAFSADQEHKLMKKIDSLTAIVVEQQGE